MLELTREIRRIETLSPLAIAKWGKRAQVTKTIEELAELQVQLAKVLNDSPTTTEAIVDEIADAIFVTLQMRLNFGSEFVDKRIAYKLDRLAKRLAVP